LNSTDLLKLTSSDNDYYYSDGDWNIGSYLNSEAIDFEDFGVSFPLNLISIDSVSLNFEWARESAGVVEARLRVWDSDTSDWVITDLSMPPSATDQLDVLDLSSYITDLDDLDDLIIEFQAHNGLSGLESRQDLVELVVEYTIDNEAPVVSNIGNDPEYPTCSDDVLICVDVIDASDIDTVSLEWDNGMDSASFSMTNTVGNTYCRTLSASSVNADDGMTVLHEVYTEDEYGNNDTFTGGNFTFDCESPVADANGDYFCNEGIIVALDASASIDSVDSSLDYAWDLDADGLYDDAIGVSPNFVCLDDGNYSVSVEATDDAGHSDTADSTVTVSNVAPVANANGVYSANEGSIAVLSASVTDAGTLDTHTYAWDLDNDGIFESVGQNVNYTCIDDSVNLASVEVTDDDGGVDTNITTVTCNNVAPVVDAGIDQTVNEGDLITIFASFTDVGILDIHEASINWAGSTNPLGVVTSPFNDSYTFCNDGSYLVTVSVTDDDSGVNSDTLTITVENVAPTFDNLPESISGVIGDMFTYDVDASDVGCDMLSYSLVGGEPVGMIINSITGEISWTPAIGQDGDFEVTVRVSDGVADVDSILGIHVYDYKIEFGEDWNLFSIPLVPTEDDTSIDNVLNEDISSGAEVVWSYSYDEEEGRNVWNYNTPISDGSRWWATTSRLQNIIPGYGYYIKMNNASTLYQDGEKYYGAGSAGLPMPPQVRLTTGWNLIGHYGMNTVLKSNEINDLSGGLLTDLAEVTLLNKNTTSTGTLIPTEGYWAFVTGQNNLYYAPSEADY